MIKFENWMVGLDLTLTDQILIAYTKRLFEILKPKKVYFIHIQKEYEFPPELNMPSVEPQTRESIRVRLEELVKNSFPEDRIECEVFKGEPSFDLWRETYLHGIDLFLAGSKHSSKGRGIIPKRFAKKAFCSTLFVPDNAVVQLTKIFVPLDFSDNSREALSLAIKLTEKSDDCEIICHNVYELPYAYSLTDSPRQRYVELMEKNTAIQFHEFTSNMPHNNIEINSIFQVRDYPYIAEHIKNEAEAQDADMIIMAAGGKSKLSRIFLGSETEKMVEMEKNIPLLILKIKEKKVKLWDILTSI